MYKNLDIFTTKVKQKPTDSDMMVTISDIMVTDSDKILIDSEGNRIWHDGYNHL